METASVVDNFLYSFKSSLSKGQDLRHDPGNSRKDLGPFCVTVSIGIVGRAVSQVRMIGRMDVHGVLHPLCSKGGPTILDNIPERYLQILPMRQLLSYVHDFPLCSGLSDWSNLGCTLPQSNGLSSVVERKHTWWTLAMSEYNA